MPCLATAQYRPTAADLLQYRTFDVHERICACAVLVLQGALIVRTVTAAVDMRNIVIIIMRQNNEKDEAFTRTTAETQPGQLATYEKISTMAMMTVLACSQVVQVGEQLSAQMSR